MMKFESGKSYNFKDLFAQKENGKIIIPDLQRDYCWGDNKELILSFIDTIISNKDSKLILGLIYGYYEDIRPNIQLCDGQQRLTTLYLLVGLINKMCEGNPFEPLLMSEYEREEDDKEPRLLYGIRDSSLFFLSDLVDQYLLNEGNIEDEPSKDIMKSNFWTESYETDPTITSMLNALDIIYERLKEKKYDNDYLVDMGEKITTNLSFIFYNMGDRKNGEETFVVINRTGEPLTATENLKPKIVTLGEQTKWVENSRKWEEIDTWLWQIRNKEINDTSDNGMKEFLRIVAGLYPSKRNTDEDYAALLAGDNDNYEFPTSISMEEIYEVYSRTRELASDENFYSACELFKFPLEQKLQLNQYFILLPTLRHYIAFQNKQESIRVYRFFRNLTRYTTISTANKSVIYAINTIEGMEHEDIISLLDEENVKAGILTEEEKLRLEVIRHQCYVKDESGYHCEDVDRRNKIEEMFEGLSSMDYLISGEIKGVLKWCCGHQDFKAENVVLTNSENQESANTFEKYSNYFKKYFSEGGTIKTQLALLAFGKLGNYPIENNTMRSLPKGKSDWDAVMKRCNEKENKTNNLCALGDFLSEYQGVSHEDYMSKHVDKPDNIYGTILKWCETDETDENILKVDGIPIYDWQRNFRVFCPHIIRMLNKYNATGNDVFIIDGKAIKASLDETFSQIWIYENETVVLDHQYYDISFDSFKEGDEWVLQIFKRDNGRENFQYFEQITEDATIKSHRKEYRFDNVAKWLEMVKSKIELIKSYSQA